MFFDGDVHEAEAIRKRVRALSFLEVNIILKYVTHRFHHVQHYPENRRGMNIAVAFLRQRDGMPKTRFASDIIDFWRMHHDGKISFRDTDCDEDRHLRKGILGTQKGSPVRLIGADGSAPPKCPWDAMSLRK